MTPAPMTRDDVIRSTAEHIRKVGWYMATAAEQLSRRAVVHDASKWSPEEWSAFETATPKLKAMTYGSDEYKAAIASIAPALKHHYEHNTHHPEHHANGVDGMTLLDLIEMLCDWKAAGERHADGSIERSLKHNQTRFDIGPQLNSILRNTCIEMGWIQ